MTPSPTFERETLRHITPMTAALQLAAAGLCLLAQCLMDIFAQDIVLAHYIWVSLATVGAILTKRATSMRHLFLIGVFNVQTIAIGFGVLTTRVAEPTFWFLPIGLCITLTTATIYHRVQEYVFSSAMVWATLSLVIRPVLETGVQQVFVPVVVLGSMVVGAASSMLFRDYRSSNYRMQRQLHEHAHIDPLTSLPNRRSFMVSWDGMLHSAGRPLCFMMLDIDNFKRVNDDFGHDVGDTALVKVAKVLLSLPESVTVARLGGEEFAVLCALSEADAAELAGKIVFDVNQLSVRDRRLSISVGMTMQRDGEDTSSVMQRADEALYKAKKGGKNRFEWGSVPSVGT